MSTGKPLPYKLESCARCADMEQQLAQAQARVMELENGWNAEARLGNEEGERLLDQVTELTAQLAQMQEQRDHEAMMHAACLSIAEGYSGWDVPFSLATKSVRSLRQHLAQAQERITELEGDFMIVSDQRRDLTAQLATVTAERDQRKESFYADALMLRNVELLRACKECGGLGVKVYANTTTWRGGCGGQAMTNGVCDHCWGSGDRYLQWVDLRGAAQQLARFQAEIEDLRSKLQKALSH